MGVKPATRIADYIRTISWIWDKLRTKTTSEARLIHDAFIAVITFSKDMLEDIQAHLFRASE